MSWTDERTEKLKKLWAEGLSASQIANQLGGVTRNAVIGKVHRLGLSGRATLQRKTGFTPAGKKSSVSRKKLTVRGSHTIIAKYHPEAKARMNQSSFKSNGKDYTPMEDHSEHQCKWPLDGKDGRFIGFCSCERTDGSSYCEKHQGIAHPTTRVNLKRRVA